MTLPRRHKKTPGVEDGLDKMKNEEMMIRPAVLDDIKRKSKIFVIHSIMID